MLYVMGGTTGVRSVSVGVTCWRARGLAGNGHKSIPAANVRFRHPARGGIVACIDNRLPIMHCVDVLVRGVQAQKSRRCHTRVDFRLSGGSRVGLRVVVRVVRAFMWYAHAPPIAHGMHLSVRVPYLR